MCVRARVRVRAHTRAHTTVGYIQGEFDFNIGAQGDGCRHGSLASILLRLQRHFRPEFKQTTATTDLKVTRQASSTLDPKVTIQTTRVQRS